MKTAVVTDFAVDLQPEVIERLNIHVIKGWVRLGITLHRNLSANDVLAGIERGETFAAVAADHKEIRRSFENLLNTYDHVLMICVSTELGDAFHVASQEALHFPGQVTVINSRAASIGLGMQVIRAAELAQQGHSVTDIVRTVQRLHAQAEQFLVLKSLKHMHLHGHVGGLQNALGKMLGVNPVLAVRNGKISPLSQPRGFQKALDQMAELALDYGRQHPQARLAFAYTPGSEHELQALKSKLLGTGLFQDTGTVEFGGSVAANTGPGCLSISVEPAA